MTKRVDLAKEKPLHDFIKRQGRIREPIELMLDDNIVAKIVSPTELSGQEAAALLARGRELVRRARERNKGVPAKVIEREVRQAVNEVRRRHQR